MCKEPGGEAPQDKRGAVKWHNRRAIMVAAGELAAAHGLQGFSVNDLAKRAGVSRRTIFNHFPSAEDAVYEYLSDRVGKLIGAMIGDLPQPQETQDHSLGQMYRDLVQAMRSHDSHHLAESLEPILMHMADPRTSPVTALWGFRLTHGATERVGQALRDRLPRHSGFELALVSTTIINSMAVCMDEWFVQTRGVRGPESKQVWDQLLTEALHVLGRGFDT